MGSDAVPFEVGLRHPHRFGGDALAVQIRDRPECGIVRHAQHPAHRLPADLGEAQLANLLHVGAGLHHPVVAGNPRIQHALLDVARHLLGTHHQAVDFVVVDGRKVRARGNVIEYPARSNNSLVASFRLPAGMPSFRSLLMVVVRTSGRRRAPPAG